jgi:hypothetical protein
MTMMPMPPVAGTIFVEKRPATASRNRSSALDAMSPLALRVHGEFREMPGLRLTVRQAARLFSIPVDIADAVLHELRGASFLACSSDGAFSFSGEPSRRRSATPAPSDITAWTHNMSTRVDTEATVTELLSDASLDRLACLLRHWTWADEAMTSFDRELGAGWDFDDDPMSDRPFGAYYHWCALLCAFGEAALDRGLLSALELEPIRQDLEASLPRLRACRQLLVVIPASLEEHPRIVDLLRDEESLPRLRRIHHAFGEALRKEQVSREVDSLIPD